MSEPSQEQIPNHHVLAEMEAALHTKVSELVIANARIRTRDERIRALQMELDVSQMETRTLESARARYEGLSDPWPTADRE